MRCIGAVTIGQAPRPDVMSELTTFLGPDVRVIEYGALDAFSKAQVEEISPKTTGPLLVTRLRDGSEVRIGEDFLIPHLQECILRLQDEAELILMLCTESLPEFRSKKLIVYPSRVLFNAVAALGVQRIGVMTPAPEQLAHQQRRWCRVVPNVFVEAASPYAPLQQLQSLSEAFCRNDVDLVVMDCVGYTQAMKQSVQTFVNRPVLLARTVLARMAAELVG